MKKKRRTGTHETQVEDPLKERKKGKRDQQAASRKSFEKDRRTHVLSREESSGRDESPDHRSAEEDCWSLGF